MSRLIFSLLCLLTFSLALPYSGGNPFVEKFVNAASRHFEAKEYSDALEDIKQALERDDQHLGALELWANISETTNDNDTTAYALHTWLNIVESSEENLVPRKKIKEVEDIALKAHQITKCRGVTRSDFRYNGKTFYLLEVNTQPGMTELSLVPEIAKYKGISFYNLIRWIIDDASINR